MAIGNSLVLQAGRIYGWDELADRFRFQPGYFSVAGGMVPSTATDSLLLITHPGGGKSFDYRDYWDGPHLIYTGRGKVGDQQRTGQNLALLGRWKMYERVNFHRSDNFGGSEGPNGCGSRAGLIRKLQRGCAPPLGGMRLAR